MDCFKWKNLLKIKDEIMRKNSSYFRWASSPTFIFSTEDPNICHKDHRKMISPMIGCHITLSRNPKRSRTSEASSQKTSDTLSSLSFWERCSVRELWAKFMVPWGNDPEPSCSMKWSALETWKPLKLYAEKVLALR